MRISKLREGIVEVPKRWLREFEEGAMPCFESLAVGRQVELLWGSYHALAGYIEAKEEMELAGNSDMADFFEKRIVIEETAFEDLAKETDAFCKRVQIRLPYNLKAADLDYNTNNISDIYEPYKYHQLLIYPEKDDFKKYGIEDATILPNLFIVMDLFDDHATMAGKYSFEKNEIYMTGRQMIEILNNNPDIKLEKLVTLLSKSYLSTLEHEMIHYMQGEVLPAKEAYEIVDQVAYMSDKEYYLTSNTEFQPQIISAYARLIQWEKYRRGDDINDLVKEFVIRDEFFLTLKVGSKKWKEAVKLFYIYVLEKEG